MEGKRSIAPTLSSKDLPWPKAEFGVKPVSGRAARSDFQSWMRMRCDPWARMIGFSAMLFCCVSASAEKLELEIIPEPEAVRVLAGTDRTIRVVLRNPTPRAVRTDLRATLYQLNSATAVRVSDRPWKRLQVLPGQTVIEDALFLFPPVNAPTRFAIRWMGSTDGAWKNDGPDARSVPETKQNLRDTGFSTAAGNGLLGVTVVVVYPGDLLKQLKPLAGLQPLGVFDPEGEVRPLLRRSGVNFQDLEESGLVGFTGDLAIIGPFKSQARMGENLRADIARLSKRGVAIVWIQPPAPRSDFLLPSFYSVPSGKTSVVVVQAGLLSDLADNPVSQLNLIELARQALHPAAPQLPGLAENPQP